MNIDGIRLFVLTARHLTITQAARELHIGQPAASRQLKRLQEELGIKFLERHGRGIKLTQPGRTFLKEISPICLQLEALQKSYARTQESLTIAGSHSASAYLLPPLLSRFSDEHPSVKVTLHSGSSAEVEELLSKANIDLAILTSPTISSASFHIESWRREPLTAFVRSSNPLAKKTIQISESDEIRLVIRIRKEGRSDAETELRGFATKGAKFKTLMHCDSSDSVKEIVRHGACVGILYHDTVKREIDQGEFKTVRISGLDVTRQSYIVYSKERPLSAHAREFLALLRASVPTDSPAKATTSRILKGLDGTRSGNDIARTKFL